MEDVPRTVSMESGLEDRNNGMSRHEHTIAHAVSMESGLEDRNNELQLYPQHSEQQTSQWSPA